MKFLEELKNPVFWRDVSCEFMCTFILLAYLCGSGLPWTDEKVTLMSIGLPMGLLVFVLIDCFGHISGAHMNPAVSVGFCVSRDISIVRGIFYIIAQCVGGIAGSAFTHWGLTPAYLRDSFMGPTHPGPSVTPFQAVVMEVFLTFTLMIAVYGAVDGRNRNVYMPGLPVGMVVAINISLLGHFSGASMNPALTLGPSVSTGKFVHHWIYWVGPILGAVLAAIIYKYVFILIQNKFGPEDKAEAQKETELETMLTEKQMEESDGLHKRKTVNT